MSKKYVNVRILREDKTLTGKTYIKKQEQEKILREMKSLVQKYESLTNG